MEVEKLKTKIVLSVQTTVSMKQTKNWYKQHHSNKPIFLEYVQCYGERSMNVGLE